MTYLKVQHYLYLLRYGVPNSGSTEACIKECDMSGDSDVDGENCKHLMLLVAGLSIRYTGIFRSSFPTEHKCEFH